MGSSGRGMLIRKPPKPPGSSTRGMKPDTEAIHHSRRFPPPRPVRSDRRRPCDKALCGSSTRPSERRRLSATRSASLRLRFSSLLLAKKRSTRLSIFSALLYLNSARGLTARRTRRLEMPLDSGRAFRSLSYFPFRILSSISGKEAP